VLLAFIPFIPRVVHAATPNYCDGPRAGVIGYRGTITVHSGIPRPCVVNILGGATLTAGGETAPQIPGKSTRAVFRVIGRGLDDPGGVTIVVGASPDTGNTPELDNLNKPATLTLAHGTVLVRYDFARGRFVAVPDGKVQQALVAYKIIRRGTLAALQSAPSPAPSDLPATGGGPWQAIPWLAGALLLTRHGRRRVRTPGGKGARRARLIALGASGIALAVALGTYEVMERRETATGFGSLAAAQGPAPHRGGASEPPTRLVIPAIGVDAGMTMLEAVGGAWQVPSYSAGYLAGGAWPGHAGNEAITGHDDKDGMVFRRLNELRAGDEVRVYAGARLPLPRRRPAGRVPDRRRRAAPDARRDAHVDHLRAIPRRHGSPRRPCRISTIGRSKAATVAQPDSLPSTQVAPAGSRP